MYWSVDEANIPDTVADVSEKAIYRPCIGASEASRPRETFGKRLAASPMHAPGW